MDIKTAILSALAEKGPMKGTDLVTAVLMKLGRNLEYDNLDAELDRLVTFGNIVEVEYVLPTAGRRVKSIYFPAGSKVSIV